MLSVKTWWHLTVLSSTSAAFFNIVTVVCQRRGVILRCRTAHSFFFGSFGFRHKSSRLAGWLALLFRAAKS